MVARASAARAASSGAAPRDHAAAMRTGYLQALMNPKTGPLVGIPSFIPIQTQRQRVRSVATVTTSTGSLTANVNVRRMVCSDLTPLKWLYTDGGSDVAWGAAQISNGQAANTNAEHTGAQFGDGSDLKARVVALQITVKNVSSLNDRNGMFFALQERHHHNLANKTSSEVSSDAHCKIQSATDGDITLLYRPVQPREVEDWQYAGIGYPDEIQNTSADGGPLDPYPGFLGVWWKGDAVPQSFFIEVDAIVEYAGETKDLLSSDPHSGAAGATAAQPRDIPIIVQQVQQAEASPSHHRNILSQIGRAIGRAINPLTRRGRANLGTVRRTAGYLGAAYRAGGLPGVGVAASYGIGRAAGGAIRGAYNRRPRRTARNYSPYRLGY